MQEMECQTFDQSAESVESTESAESTDEQCWSAN